MLDARFLIHVVISTESPALSGCSGEIRPQMQSHSYLQPDVSTEPVPSNSSGQALSAVEWTRHDKREG